MARACRTSWLLAAAFVALAGPAFAQLGEATPEEAKIGRPSPNTPITDKTPPKADPRDFSGMWRNAPRPAGPPPAAGGAAGGAGGGPPPASPVRASSRFCIPGTMILAGGEAGTEILQRPDQLRIVTEEHHMNRRVYIDQPHTQPLARSINGDSVGRWEGDALVIETVGFIGYGVSPTLVRTERLSKSADGATLIDDVSYADPSGRATPRSSQVKMIWAPGTRILEYICEDGSDAYMGDYK